MYEIPTKDLTPEEAEKAMAPVQAAAEPPIGSCIHLPIRPVHRTITIRDSLRVMDLCEECYGVMDRAGCIAEVV